MLTLVFILACEWRRHKLDFDVSLINAFFALIYKWMLIIDTFLFGEKDTFVVFNVHCWTWTIQVYKLLHIHTYCERGNREIKFRFSNWCLTCGLHTYLRVRVLFAVVNVRKYSSSNFFSFVWFLLRRVERANLLSLTLGKFFHFVWYT